MGQGGGGDKRAVTLNEFLKEEGRFLGTTLVGTNISVIISSAVATNLAAVWLGANAALVSTLVMTTVILVFCEIIPKTIAAKSPERIALLNSRVLYLFSLIIKPVRNILNFLSKVFIRLFVKDPTKQPLDSVNIDESIFKSMVDVGSREGNIEPGERDLIHKAFRLDDIPVSDIMIPRDRVVAVPLGIGENGLLGLIEQKGYSRYPVYGKDIDEIFGFVHAKDLLRLRSDEHKRRRLSIKSILRKPIFISENRNALSVLLQFQKNKRHMGIVVDKLKKTTGMVTMEDILEELFGEIMDETDREVNNNV